MHKSSCSNLTVAAQKQTTVLALFRMGLFGSADGWGVGRSTYSVTHTYNEETWHI